MELQGSAIRTKRNCIRTAKITRKQCLKRKNMKLSVNESSPLKKGKVVEALIKNEKITSGPLCEGAGRKTFQTSDSHKFTDKPKLPNHYTNDCL